ncbi:MAG: hypothetical protein WCY21_04860 [Candidatus Cloacimonadaceae bacterium]|jgi:hypothetical protein|nr:hypothetical protein [Candidatus Cloacimonadota bacterium]MDX9950096.1 hypothetical protein [Candidatus Syntrophosphaera sp.]NLN85100.1 hypothetical protein [Candidatus Cloacimonadota bacterium]
MKKLLIVSTLLLFGITFCLAQVNISPAPQQDEIPELQIQIKTMMPDISVVQIKSDTYAPAAKYDFTINMDVIRQASKQQLENWNQKIKNWLEESK